MSYFEELQNDPNTVWTITRRNVITKEYKEFFSVYATYDIAVRELEDWCDRMGFDLYEKQPTEFTVCESGLKVPSYSVIIYARTFIK